MKVQIFYSNSVKFISLNWTAYTINLKNLLKTFLNCCLQNWVNQLKSWKRNHKIFVRISKHLCLFYLLKMLKKQENKSKNKNNNNNNSIILINLYSHSIPQVNCLDNKYLHFTIKQLIPIRFPAKSCKL